MSRIRLTITCIAVDLALYLAFWCWYIALAR